MSFIVRSITTACITMLAAVLLLVAPAQAGRDLSNAPYPSCGGHFQLYRNGTLVRVVGTDLYVFSRGYMLVFTSANGRGHGPYNASPYGGANFQFSSGSSSRTTVSVTLTNSNNSATLCSSNYFV